jgi:hypothetical protein
MQPSRHSPRLTDGGGPGCFSQLVLLDEVMSRIAHDKSIDKKQMYPADYFDLIGGVGFGASVLELSYDYVRC